MDENNGFFYCPVCGRKAAVWQSDFNADEVGYDFEGITHFYSCSNCKAEIEATENFEEEH